MAIRGVSKLVSCMIGSAAMKHSIDLLYAALDGLLPEIIALRHELHTSPEIALHEHATRNYLVSWLTEQGVLDTALVYEPFLGTDLVFEKPGNDRSTVIGLRADMDALPVTERTELSYQSRISGMMHACGHDGHMAMLAGAIVLLHRAGIALPYTVRAIFQPGEEQVCAGADLVSAGVCDGLTRVYALHGWPGLEVGKVSSKPGVMLAAADTYEIICTGKAAHGATPEQGNNPLVPVSEIVGRLLELHACFSREHGAVITPCAVMGGHNTNTIPGSATILGTTRYLDPQVGNRMEQEIASAVQEISGKYGTACDISHKRLYHLPVVNNSAEVQRVRDTAELVLGEGCYQAMDSHYMVAEDFAFYLDKVPGCMFQLGLGEAHAKLHSDTFDFADEALEAGMLMLASLALGIC